MLTKLGYFGREAMTSLRRNLLMTLAGIMTVAVSLFLFGGVLLLQRLVDHGLQRWRGGVELVIFMKADAADNDIQAVTQQLDALKQSDVKSYDYLDKTKAYEDFKRVLANEQDIVKGMDPSEVPTSFRVVPKDAELTEGLKQRFENRPSVLKVLTPDDQVNTILKVTSVFRTVFFVVGGVALAAALFLIVNTIRLATFARRREIQVMKLVGATNMFIRVPFILEGLVEGAVGAGIAFAGVYFLKVLLTHWVNGSATALFQSFFVTTGDAIGVGFLVIVIGAAVGMIGSVIGLRRFLEV